MQRAIGKVTIAVILIAVVIVAGVTTYFVTTSLSHSVTSSTSPTINPTVAQYLAGLPNYYPSNYSYIIQRAMQEGSLLIYASFTSTNFQPVVSAFQQKYPFIHVQWINMPSATTLTRYLQEESAGTATADVILNNSPIDTYSVAINQSQAYTYCSPEQKYYPPNLNFPCRVFSPLLSFQIMMVNTAKVPPSQIPTGFKSLAELVKANSSFWKGKVGGYNFGLAVTGLIPAYSLKYGENTVLEWFTTYKNYSGYLQSTSASLTCGQVVSGQLYVAIGALAICGPLHDKAPTTTMIVYPSEGTYGYPAQLFITKVAAHPYAAMLFVDFYLSQVGQTVQMAAYYASARTDMPSQVSPFTYASIVNATRGNIIFDTFPPAYSQSYATKVETDWVKAMASG